ncbi:MAG: DUF475 domain-containing protein [Opitutales bacterium]
MFKYFKWSFIILFIGLACAFFKGDSLAESFNFLLSAIAIIILELSLSFDNAVVNAIKLKNMSQIWRRRFLTWGIVIAVFGMRFVFPLLIVSVFAGISMYEVLLLALKDPDKYAHHLHESHYGIASFGSMFLLMLFLGFMFEQGKKIHWLTYPEKLLEFIGKIPFAKEIIAFILLGILQIYLLPEQRTVSMIAGSVGIFLHFGIEFLASKFEEKADVMQSTAKAGFVSFMYLEIIDASFSLDGALGAFALSKDVVIITIGLTVGAIFVRSLTIMLVERNTLEKFPFLQHGAYWAVGALSMIMLYSAVEEISEIYTAGLSVLFILASVVSSVIYGKSQKINIGDKRSLGDKFKKFFKRNKKQS